LKNPESKPEINHKNGIKNDNRLINLEWCTAKENQAHKVTVLGCGDTFKGSRNGNSSLTEKDVLDIRQSRKTRNELAEIYKVSATHIGRIITRKLWAHI